jgi:transcription termination factor Rho
MTELSTLERKPLSDLHQIAAQLGIEQYRKYRKPQLAELIYKTATEQAVGQQAAETTTNGGETVAPTVDPETGTNGNGEATPIALEITEARPDPFGEADTAIAAPEEVEQRRQQQRGSRKGCRQTV